MAVIYTPRGRALEYSADAVNIYRGCDHGCRYCYGPDILRISRKEFHQSRLRSHGFLRQLDRDADKLRVAGRRAWVLMCFTCDPYQRLDEKLKLARHSIEILKGHDQDVTILTKGGRRSLRDFDLLSSTDAYAVSLTFTDTEHGRIQSAFWEPFAAPPGERLEVLKLAQDAGFHTWASFEPVIEPAETLTLIEAAHHLVDHFKIGKLNHHPRAATIDWRGFGWAAVALCDRLGVQYYIKKDLALEMGALTTGFWGKIA